MTTLRGMTFKPKTIVAVALGVLGLRVLVGILLEYRRYFPPDFEAAFLEGRRATFTATYAAAFYTHILSGPPALVLAAFLLWSGGDGRWRNWHRWAGRILGVLIFGAVLPGGLLMALQAFGGPAAGVGFAALAVATGICAAAAIHHARRDRFAAHQRWAQRCFLLLASPLILRLVSGVLIVTNTESLTAYCWNAWLSWLLPLAIYEVSIRSPMYSSHAVR